MADKTNIELLNSPENIHYEAYDFPVIKAGNSGYGIDWESMEDTPFVEKLSKGIRITQENAAVFTQEFERLRTIHAYRSARLDWIQKSNGWCSLECIMPDAGNGVWMYIYSEKGDHAGSPMEYTLTPETRLDVHNLDYADTGIFLVESLAQYLQPAGITFPYIRTNLEGTHQETKFDFSFTAHDLSYSFELPYEPTFNYAGKLSIYAQNRRLKLGEISPEKFARDDENFVTLETDTTGKKFWKATRIPSPGDAVLLFDLLSIPLKWRSII